MLKVGPNMIGVTGRVLAIHDDEIGGAILPAVAVRLWGKTGAPVYNMGHNL